MARRIEIADFIGVPFAIATDDGEKLGEKLRELLTAGETVELSLRGLEVITSSFVNPAIGTLYGCLDARDIESQLQISDASPSDTFLIDQVKKQARAYYAQPEAFDHVTDGKVLA